VLPRILDSVPPAAGAEVMGTAIISIALSLDGENTLSEVMLAIAAVIWVALAMLVAMRAVRDPAAVRANARTPAALTAPVATAVLGTRLTMLGWGWAGTATLVIASVLLAALLRPVLAGWKSPAVGVSLLLPVSVEALAVLGASLATLERTRWLLIAALAAFGVGLVLYVVVICWFDTHELAGGHGDHWIAGGAMGLCALAAAKITLASNALGVLAGTALQDLALGLWLLSVPWLVVLVSAEVRWPRLRYDLRRWSTVFPIGMYAASGFAVGDVAHAGAITSFARVWVWVAVAAWAIVGVAGIGRAIEVVRGRGSRDAGTPAPTTPM
jgi:tellurite resistance protein TehA-like permease